MHSRMTYRPAFWSAAPIDKSTSIDTNHCWKIGLGTQMTWLGLTKDYGLGWNKYFVMFREIS